jgi:RNA polymerase sigma factor (sigma-70 family)
MRQQGSFNPVVDACVDSRCPRSWERFIQEFDPSIRSGIGRVLRRCAVPFDRDRMDDLRQEVYCRMLDRDARILRSCRGRGDREVAAYLRQVASNVTVDRLRIDGTKKRGVAITVQSGDLSKSLPDPRSKGAAATDRRILVRGARRRFFQRCRELLGPGLRHSDTAMLYLAAFEGWPSREIGSRYGLSPGAVDSRLSRLGRRLAAGGLQLPARGRLAS